MKLKRKHRNTGVTPKSLLDYLWEFIGTIVIAIVFTTISLAALVVFGMILALPIVVILMVYQHLSP